jgi:peptide chain release factor subunit 3
VPVTVTTVYRDDLEVQAAKGGENLRLRLTGIDDDDIAAGFVVCSRNIVVPTVTYFNAQLQARAAADQLACSGLCERRTAHTRWISSSGVPGMRLT